MRSKIIPLLALCFSMIGIASFDLLSSSSQTDSNTFPMTTLHDFSAKTLDGKDFDFSQLKGKKVMVVNTASECGMTPQYENLQELYEEFGGEDFEIIGFPANNFAQQEPGSDDEIQSFCQKNYGVTFPMMSKISVKGDDQHPVYQWLTSKTQNGVDDYVVKWNFHKFLVDQDGNLVREVDPQTLPIDPEIIDWIRK